MSKNSKKTTPDLSDAINEFNQFDIQKTIQSIWSETNLESKKRRTIDEVVSNFKFKEKQQHFKNAILACKDNKGVDKILTNIVLYGEGLNTLKI